MKQIEIVPESHIDGLSKNYVLKKMTEENTAAPPILFIELPRDLGEFYKENTDNENVLDSINAGTAQDGNVAKFLTLYKGSEKREPGASPRRAHNFYTLLTKINKKNQSSTEKITTVPIDIELIALWSIRHKTTMLEGLSKSQDKGRNAQLGVLEAAQGGAMTTSQAYNKVFGANKDAKQSFKNANNDLKNFAEGLGKEITDSDTKKEKIDWLARYTEQDKSEYLGRRDRVMADNIIEAMGKLGQNSAVLLVGAAHVRGIITELKAKNVQISVTLPIREKDEQQLKNNEVYKHLTDEGGYTHILDQLEHITGKVIKLNSQGESTGLVDDTILSNVKGDHLLPENALSETNIATRPINTNAHEVNKIAEQFINQFNPNLIQDLELEHRNFEEKLKLEHGNFKEKLELNLQQKLDNNKRLAELDEEQVRIQSRIEQIKEYKAYATAYQPVVNMLTEKQRKRTITEKESLELLKYETMDSDYHKLPASKARLDDIVEQIGMLSLKNKALEIEIKAVDEKLREIENQLTVLQQTKQGAGLAVETHKNKNLTLGDNQLGQVTTEDAVVNDNPNTRNPLAEISRTSYDKVGADDINELSWRFGRGSMPLDKMISNRGGFPRSRSLSSLEESNDPYDRTNRQRRASFSNSRSQSSLEKTNTRSYSAEDKRILKGTVAK